MCDRLFVVPGATVVAITTMVRVCSLNLLGMPVDAGEPDDEGLEQTTSLEKAQNTVLGAVSSQVPATQKREEAHVDYGAVVAVASALLDFAVAFPYTASRWREQGARLAAVPAPGGAGAGVIACTRTHSPFLIASHLTPWMVGQCATGLSAWDSAGWAVAHAAVQSAAEAALTDVLPAPVVKATAACLAFPLSLICLRTALLGSGDVLGTKVYGDRLISGGWLRTWEGRMLLAGSALFSVGQSKLRAFITAKVLAKIQDPPNPREAVDCAVIYLQPLQAAVVADLVATVVLLPAETLLISLVASSAGVEMVAPTPGLLLFPTGRTFAIIGAQLALRVGVASITRSHARNLVDVISLPDA